MEPETRFPGGRVGPREAGPGGKGGARSVFRAACVSSVTISIFFTWRVMWNIGKYNAPSEGFALSAWDL